MKFCTNCGFMLQDDARFCSNCGTPSATEAPVAQSVMESPVETTMEPIIEPAMEPVIESVMEPVVEPVIEPVVEQVTETVSEETAEEQSISEPVIEENNEMVEEMIVESTEDIQIEQTLENVSNVPEAQMYQQPVQPQMQQMYQQPVQPQMQQMYQQPVQPQMQQMYQQPMQPQMRNNSSIAGGSFVMKIIFEILAIVCGILVAVSIFMPVVNVTIDEDMAEFYDVDDEVNMTAFEAMQNAMDIFDDIDFEDADYDDVTVMIFTLSALLPIASIAFGVIFVIAKLIGLIGLKKTKKVRIGGVVSLLTLQFFYYYLADMLVYTDKDNIGMLYNFEDMESKMSIGWFIPVILVSITIIYGLVINIIENLKSNKENESKVSYFVTIGFSLVMVIIGIIAAVGVKEPMLKVAKIKMEPCITVKTSVEIIETYDDVFEKMSDEELERIFDMDLDELLKDITMLVVYMAATIVVALFVLSTFTGTVRNGILGISGKKLSGIGNIIISTISIVLLFVNRMLINNMDDLDYIKACETSAKATKVVNTLTIYAVVILVLSIIYVILQNTAFKPKKNNNNMINYNYQNQGYNPGMPNMMQ